MSLTKEENDTLLKNWNAFQALKDQFFNFDLSTRVQLLVSQMQFFQVIASVAIALSGILLSLEVIQLNWWLVLSGIASIFLLIFASSYTRETIDSQDKDLKQVGKDLNERQEILIKKIFETKEKGDFKIFQTYIDGERKNGAKPKNQIPQYTGKVVMFIFLMSIFLGITSVLSTEYHCIFQGVMSPVIFMGLMTLSIMLSTKDWGGGLVRFISKKI
jgi:membrane protein implicated in regulation of membrane protease activity